MKIRNMGTKTFTAELKEKTYHDGYVVILKDKGSGSILIETQGHIDELKAILEEIESRWNEYLF